MKKFVCILVGGVLLLSIVGCGSTNKNELSNNDSNRTNAVLDIANNDSGSAGKTEFRSMNLNETISNDFMEVKFTTLATADVINPSDTSGYYTYYDKQDGERYIYLEGTYKNTAGYSCNPGNSLVNIIFDDKYTYSAEVDLEIDNYLSNIYSISPMDSKRIVILASIPEEVLNSYSEVKIQWGMTNMFGTTDADHYTPLYDWADCTMGYEMHAMK